MKLLLSYPRSGSHIITNMVKACGDYIHKRHTPAIMQEHSIEKLVLLLRDYRECLIREIYPNEYHITNQMVDNMLGGYLHSAEEYFDLIDAYDKFSGDKTVVYYEKLLTKKHEAFRPVARLLGLDDSSLNWDLEFAESLAAYGTLALSGGNLKYHQYKIENMNYYEKVILGISPRELLKYLHPYLN